MSAFRLSDRYGIECATQWTTGIVRFQVSHIIGYISNLRFDVDIRSGIHQWNDSFKAGQKSGSTALFDWPAFLVIRKRPRQSATDRAYTAKHSTPGTVSPPHSVAPLPPHRDSVDALNGAQRA